jgi:two-component system, NarL family, nitrate/nitrite response regulator NarL
VTGTSVTRVMVVDDHRILVESVVRLLSDAPGIEVAAVAYNIAEALAEPGLSDLDVILMDYRLPDGDGVEATHRLRSQTDAKVLIVTGHAEAAVLRDAIRAGACGLVSKTASADELIESIGQAAAGATVAPPGLLRQALNPSSDCGTTLTVRELEVLGLLAAGLSNPAMAAQLSLSLNTIRNHVQHLLVKLGAHSKHEALALARRQGLLRPSP